MEVGSGGIGVDEDVGRRGGGEVEAAGIGVGVRG